MMVLYVGGRLVLCDGPICWWEDGPICWCEVCIKIGGSET